MNASSLVHTRAWIAVAIVMAVGVGFAIARLTSGPRAVPASFPESAPSEQEGASKPLRLEASYLKVVGIDLATVSPGSLSAEVRASGVVESSPNGQAVVSAHVAGSVTQVIKRLGDSARVGETLAWVASSDAAAIAAERTAAEAKMELARSNLEREKRLFYQHVTPRQDLEAAQAELTAADAEANRARVAAHNVNVGKDGRSVRVVSPISGRITATNIAVGAFIQPDTELFRVADARRIQIEAAVTVADAARITPGDSATVTTNVGATRTAQVQSLTPTLNVQSRQVEAVLSLTAPSSNSTTTNNLTPGEFVQVVITPKAAAPAGFVVPEDAVQRIDNRDVVFVRDGDSFITQPVVVAARSAGRVAIVSGLHEGETIATRNAFLLKAELGKSAEGDDE